MIYAAKHYDIKRSMSEDEFQEDLKRFQYLKRLFKRYEEDDDLRVRLILNHIIVIYNCFGPAATSMLFLRLEEYKKPLKTFLLFLSYMPDNIEYNDVHFKSTDIAIDNNIAIELRKL